MKVWYRTDERTKPINFGKFVASFPGEEFFEADPVPDEELFKHDWYTIEWNGDTPSLVRRPQEDLDAEQAAVEFENQKHKDLEVAEALFYQEITTPVEVTVNEGTFTFAGGAESSQFVDSARILADNLNESDVQLVDINDQVYTFSKQSAKEIAIAVAVAFRSSYFKYKAEKVKIKER